MLSMGFQQKHFTSTIAKKKVFLFLTFGFCVWPQTKFQTSCAKSNEENLSWAAIEEELSALRKILLPQDTSEVGQASIESEVGKCGWLLCYF